MPIPSQLMPTDYDSLKALVPLAVPAIKTAIESWLTPTITKIVRSRDLTKKAKPEHISTAFEEYLLRTYARLSFMSTIVFGNQQKRLQDLYIPLTLRSSGPAQENFKIDRWLEEFVPAYKRVVVTDTAGMGKSTVLKWLFLCSIGNSNSIPIFIELRSLSAKKTILQRIHEELCPINQTFDKDLLLNLLREGTFIIFLDGFDEVTFEDRCAVTEDVQSFITKTFNNYFVLASRHETALASFGEFREFTIKPLSKKEAYTLLRRYDETQEHAESLIAELEESKYEQLKDLMENPMLVSLLFKAYSYKPKVPFKKQIFYRQVFDALFDMHDSTKGGAFVRKKNSGLDIDEFHIVMRDLGFTTAKLGKIEYEKDEISELIKRVRERNSTVLFQPSALLSDLVTTVPLFNKEGEHYKWAHKSVQDYFASQFIALDAKGNEATLLGKIYDGRHCGRFENILDMLHDTDNKSFRRVLLARLLKDYVQHYDTTYLQEFPGVSAKAIEERKQLTFGFDLALVKLSKSQLAKLLGGSHDRFHRVFSGVLPPDVPPDGLMVFQGPEGPVLHGLVAKAPFGLLRLLTARRYPYVEKAKWVPGADRELPVATAQLVSDDPGAPLNSAEHFVAINSVLRHHGYCIAIDQARRTLEAINEEGDEVSQVDELLENL